jgi:hypothetical protein
MDVDSFSHVNDNTDVFMIRFIFCQLRLNSALLENKRRAVCLNC